MQYNYLWTNLWKEVVTVKGVWNCCLLLIYLQEHTYLDSKLESKGPYGRWWNNIYIDQPERMWTPMATMTMVYIQKYKMAWIRMETPLVYMFPNSIHLVLAGIWNSNPGDNRMNIPTATTTGPQSTAIISSLIFSDLSMLTTYIQAMICVHVIYSYGFKQPNMLLYIYTHRQWYNLLSEEGDEWEGTGDCSFGLLVGFAFYLNLMEIDVHAFANYWNIALYFFIFFFLGKILF